MILCLALGWSCIGKTRYVSICKACGCMPVRMRGCRRNWVSIKNKKGRTSFTRQHRNMPCSVLLRVVAVQERKIGLLCPSVTLQYVFNPSRVLPLLVVCCGERGEPVTPDLRPHPLPLIFSCTTSHPTSLPSKYTFQVFKEDVFLCFSSIFQCMYLKNIYISRLTH